jgi:hypothetical protein
LIYCLESSSPLKYLAAFSPAFLPSLVTKSTKSWTCKELPHEKIPGTDVCNDSSTTGPLVAGCNLTPKSTSNGLYGLKPTERSSVSHSNSLSVPSM